MSLLVIDPYRFAAADTFVMGYRQDVMAWSSVDGSSGITYTRQQSSGFLGGGVSNHSSTTDASDGDYWEWFVNLAAGTYTLTVIHSKGSDCGSVDWKIDGATVGTIDYYNGSATNNNASEITGIIVAADGNYTLQALVNGKNASSTDYFMPTNSVTLTRTGA